MIETVFQNLNWGEMELAKHEIDTARLDAEVLLAYTLVTSRIDLHLNKDKVLSADEKQKFISYIKRRQKREPVAYIVGAKEFWSIRLKVTPDVLVPRPETEGIVEQALAVIARSEATKQSQGHNEIATPATKLWRARNDDLNILDLCTGSGCVAAALATEMPHAKITVADISPEAIGIAKQNLAFAGDRIEFFTGDLFDALRESRKFDLITANPPYVADNDFKGLDEDIRRYEPREALLAGPDGLAISKRIIQDAPKYLKAGGSLLMEIGIGQANALIEITKFTGQYKKIEVIKDYSGIDRILWTNS